MQRGSFIANMQIRNEDKKISNIGFGLILPILTAHVTRRMHTSTFIITIVTICKV